MVKELFLCNYVPEVAAVRVNPQVAVTSIRECSETGPKGVSESPNRLLEASSVVGRLVGRKALEIEAYPINEGWVSFLCSICVKQYVRFRASEVEESYEAGCGTSRSATAGRRRIAARGGRVRGRPTCAWSSCECLNYSAVQIAATVSRFRNSVLGADCGCKSSKRSHVVDVCAECCWRCSCVLPYDYFVLVIV